MALLLAEDIETNPGPQENPSKMAFYLKQNNYNAILLHYTLLA